MKILEPGHVYQLRQMDVPNPAHSDDLHQTLTFVNREPGHEHPGTQTQEVLRALIDRTYHCDSCLPSDLNAHIIHHLRMALVFHEMRGLMRKAEKGYYAPENVAIGADGHFSLEENPFPDFLRASRREMPKVPLQECKYPKYEIHKDK